MTAKFPAWPVWNHHFPEQDVTAIQSVKYRDPEDAEQELDGDFYRLAIGRNGVSSFVLLNKHRLPQLAQRPDAVVVEYQV